jgi:TatA/E family protein of Tat protein translocase
MFGIGPLELVVILVVALLVFGPKRVPELARTVGRGLAEFRRASHDLRQTLALDDLEKDLRRDLSDNQTIHRPQSRPQQTASETDGEAQTETTSSVASPEEKHPGELPLGNDHEHHDEPPELEAADGSTEETSSTKPSEPSKPADTGLGNVPVAGSNPTDPSRG